VKSFRQNYRPIYWLLALVPVLAGSALWFFRRRKLRHQKALLSQAKQATLLTGEITGLSPDEASAKYITGTDNSIYLRPKRDLNLILKSNTFSIFNLSLIGIAVAQIFFATTLDVLISLGVMVLNIGVNTFQELFAREQIETVEQAASAKSTVIRDAKVQSIDPNLIVPGDAIVIGPGDRLPVDGRLVAGTEVVLDETILETEARQVSKGMDDELYAGSICIDGRCVYEVNAVGEYRRIQSKLVGIHNARESLTPIERIIDRVLKVLLGVVFLFLLFFAIQYFRIDIPLPTDEVMDAINVIFTIAPAGLFFMIMLTYAAGTADLARFGALVRQARSVESLAQVDVMCLTRGGVLTGTQVDLQLYDTLKDQEELSETRVRQMVGDFTRSIAWENRGIKTLQQQFEGTRRQPVEQTPFMSAYGWSAASFDDPDLSGVYILAEESALIPYLTKNKLLSESKPVEPVVALKNMAGQFAGVFKRFRRKKNDEKNEKAEPQAAQPEQTVTAIDQPAEEAAASPEEPGEAKGLRGFILRARDTLLPDEALLEETKRKPKDIQDTVLVFAYYPELKPLYDQSGQPQLPDKLIPLCQLQYSEYIHPDAISTLNAFTSEGVDIKIFTQDSAESTLEMLQQASISIEGVETMLGTTGPELAALPPDEYKQAINKSTVFGDIGIAQRADIVTELRRTGHHVAVVGDSVSDVQAMQQAQLPVALMSSSQAALSTADMILLESTPRTLLRVFEKGQRIVNGLLDVLKLYLTQVFYLVLLIIAIRIVLYGFPYESIQGTLITTLTITIPAVGLALWANKGIVHEASLSRQLSYFVAPAALTMAATAMVIYGYFLQKYGDIGYAQLSVTYLLVTIGLILVLFIKPAQQGWRRWLGITQDGRLIGIVIFGFIGFFVVLAIPFARELLEIGWLNEPIDYALIYVIAGLWAVSLQLYWRFTPLKPRRAVKAPHLQEPEDLEKDTDNSEQTVISTA
jgi:magnesium-transporting ATPase (P-type)